MNSPPHVTEDRLIDLVNGLLSPTEQQATMAHLSECPACESLFKTLVREREKAKTTGVRLGDGRVERIPRQHSHAKWLIASAVVVAAAAAILVISRPHRNAPYWIEADVIATLQRGEDELAPQSLTDAFATYAHHDAKAAVEQLQNAPAPADEMLSSLRLLLLASAELNAGQVKESLADLDKLGVDTLPAQWRSEARWVQYLALREAGETEAAHTRLQTLVSEEGRIGRLAREEMARVNER